MTSKKSFALPALAMAATLGAAGLANAQAMSFSGIDANGDGTLDMTELQATFGANAELAMQTYDMNGDGMVEVSEARDVARRGAVTTGGAMEQTAEGANEMMTDPAARAAGSLDETLENVEDALDEQAASMAGETSIDADVEADMGAGVTAN